MQALQPIFDVDRADLARAPRFEQAEDRGLVEAGPTPPVRLLQNSPAQLGAALLRAAGEHDQAGEVREPRRAELARSCVEQDHRTLRAAGLTARDLQERVLAHGGAAGELIGELEREQPL